MRANNPVASENANPRIAYANNWPLKEGFLATPNIRAPNTTPIPTPAPIRPVVARPVPIILADCTTISYMAVFKGKPLLICVNCILYYNLKRGNKCKYMMALVVHDPHLID